MTALAAPILAHHALLSAVPFLVPMLVVVAVIGVLMVRDRRGDRG